MEKTSRVVGRPRGRDYPVVKQVRLGTQDAADLSRLAEGWRCSEAAAIRRAIHEKVQELRPSRSGRPRISKEQLREAAAAAREYYATDFEALEWAGRSLQSYRRR